MPEFENYYIGRNTNKTESKVIERDLNLSKDNETLIQ